MTRTLDLVKAGLAALPPGDQREAYEFLRGLVEGGSPQPAGRVDTRGSIVEEGRRCGKAGCACERGQLHGPYRYRYWYDSTGRRRREYLGPVRRKRAR